jgi:hypothetical protein
MDIKERMRVYNSAVFKNFGSIRACIACSKAYANRINVGSCHAFEKNESPTGRPKM